MAALGPVYACDFTGSGAFLGMDTGIRPTRRTIIDTPISGLVLFLARRADGLAASTVSRRLLYVVARSLMTSTRSDSCSRVAAGRPPGLYNGRSL